MAVLGVEGRFGDGIGHVEHTEQDSERARMPWLMLGGAKVRGEALRPSAVLRR